MKTTNEANEEFDQGKDYAMRRLSIRECSSHDLRLKLSQKGISQHVIEDIISDLKNRNYLSDERFAEMLVRQQARGAKGTRYIQQKLREHKIELGVSQIQEIANEECEYNELENARAFIQKKYPQYASDPKYYRRAMGALQRRGFSMDTILATLKDR